MRMDCVSVATFSLLCHYEADPDLQFDVTVFRQDDGQNMLYETDQIAKDLKLSSDGMLALSCLLSNHETKDYWDQKDQVSN
jgi:hypothetical protein